MSRAKYIPSPYKEVGINPSEAVGWKHCNGKALGKKKKAVNRYDSPYKQVGTSPQRVLGYVTRAKDPKKEKQ